MKQKLRTTLRMAAEHGHDVLVLGAFGCGYFGNPPEEVAVSFRQLLEGEFAGAFRLAIFAVLPDRNAAAFLKHFPAISARELA